MFFVSRKDAKTQNFECQYYRMHFNISLNDRYKTLMNY